MDKASPANTASPPEVQIDVKTPYGRKYYYVRNNPYRDIFAALTGRKTLTPEQIELLPQLGIKVQMPKPDKAAAPVRELAECQERLTELHAELQDLTAGLQSKEGPSDSKYTTRAAAGKRLAEISAEIAAVTERMAKLSAEAGKPEDGAE